MGPLTVSQSSGHRTGQGLKAEPNETHLVNTSAQLVGLPDPVTFASCGTWHPGAKFSRNSSQTRWMRLLLSRPKRSRFSNQLDAAPSRRPLGENMCQVAATFLNQLQLVIFDRINDLIIRNCYHFCETGVFTAENSPSCSSRNACSFETMV